MRMTSTDKYSMQSNNKRGVTFDAMETLERNSDCIDKLTSLVSNMKNDNGQKTVSHINQEFIRVGLGIKAETGKILHLKIDSFS